MQKFDHIDSLRGVAVLMVVLVHTGQTISNLAPDLEFATRYGQLGVQLFFLVSGFTLCLSMDSRAEKKFASTKFYIRRFFRIAPLYYVGIAWYFLVRLTQDSIQAGSPVMPERFEMSSVLANLSFIHGFVPGANNSIVPGGWSIGTEMAFYLIFPLLFLIIRKLATKGLQHLFNFFALTLAFSILVQGPATFLEMDEGPNRFMYYNLSNQIPVFITGIISFFLFKRGFLDRLPVIFALAGFIALTLLNIYLWRKNIPFSQTLVPALAGWSFVFLYVIFARFRSLNPALLRHIGQVSFSIYLVHFVFTRILGSVFNNLQQVGVSPEFILVMHFSLTAAVSYVIAIWTEKYIERPGIDYGRKLINWLDRASGAKQTSAVAFKTQ
ncbi:MAG: acyltransferase [Gammaproteobacteria bacterium]|nr:acyltransferase [Gammaproteobacteria bacterium]